MRGVSKLSPETQRFVDEIRRKQAREIDERNRIRWKMYHRLREIMDQLEPGDQ